MTTEVAVKRGRGRPRKVTVEVPIAALTDEQRTAMIAQGVEQFANAAAKLKELGFDIKAMFPAPPDATTVEEDVPVPADIIVGPEEVEPAPVTAGAMPGSKVGDGPGATWIPWSINHLNKDDVVSVWPEPIPGLLYPAYDKQGRQKLCVDVNGLRCWMTVGVPQQINRFFFNAYQNALDMWHEAEQFKREGPPGASWGDKDGNNTWRVTDGAPSFGMDIDGRYHPNPTQGLKLGAVANRPSVRDEAPKE